MRNITIYGGVGINPQIQKLRAGVEIVVARPGRLLDHINQGTINLSGVEVLVLDERTGCSTWAFCLISGRSSSIYRPGARHCCSRQQCPMISVGWPTRYCNPRSRCRSITPHRQARSRMPSTLWISTYDSSRRGTVAPYRHRVCPDLYAHRAPRQARGSANWKGRLPCFIASGEPVAEQAPGRVGRIP